MRAEARACSGGNVPYGLRPHAVIYDEYCQIGSLTSPLAVVHSLPLWAPLRAAIQPRTLLRSEHDGLRSSAPPAAGPINTNFRGNHPVVWCPRAVQSVLLTTLPEWRALLTMKVAEGKATCFQLFSVGLRASTPITLKRLQLDGTNMPDLSALQSPDWTASTLS